jgi:hypothetical protein
MAEKILEDRAELDWPAGQELTGCSTKQVKFVQGLVSGLTKTAAARAAGYGMEGAALRGHASRLAKSNKVRSLLAWAQTGGGGPSDVVGDPKELERLLWKHARSADPARSIKATEVLQKIAAERREAERPEVVSDPICALDKIAEIDPALAFSIAMRDGIQWRFAATSKEAALRALDAHQERIIKARAQIEAGGLVVTEQPTTKTN